MPSLSIHLVCSVTYTRNEDRASERVERVPREERRWEEVVVIPGGSVKCHEMVPNDTNLPQCGMSVVSTADVVIEGLERNLPS